MFKRCLAVAMCLIATDATAEEGVRIHLGTNSPALHMPIGDQDVEIVPAFEDYSYMMFDVCEAMGLSIEDDCLIYPMNGTLAGNAIATVTDGNKLIVYDRELSSEIGYEGAEMVIAHEIGHHYCEHLGKPADPKQELQADAFAGAAMKLMKRPLASALSAVQLFETRPSKSHPARDDRIAAITAGWNNPDLGKNCAR